MRFRTAWLVCVLCGIIGATSGCSVFNANAKKSDDKPWSISKLWKKEYQKPNSISVIWSPDVLTLTGKPPTRGFGGRVFFYNDRTQAIPVDGELIVHGYRGDPMLGESEQVHADKTFAFTAEQLTGHFSPSELGASYSVWIPWDAADGLRMEITLIPTFKGLDGTLVQGAPAKLFLPGRAMDGASPQAPTTQTVSYQQKTISTNIDGKLPQLTRETQPTTIDLPPLGTLGRPRAKSTTDVQGFTLGGAAGGFQYQPPAQNTQPNANLSPASSNGAAIGNGAVPPASITTWPEAPPSGLPIGNGIPTANMTQPGFNGNPNLSTTGISGLPGMPEQLAVGQSPPGLTNGVQASNPFAHQPWHTQTGK